MIGDQKQYTTPEGEYRKTEEMASDKEKEIKKEIDKEKLIFLRETVEKINEIIDEQDPDQLATSLRIHSELNQRNGIKGFEYATIIKSREIINNLKNLTDDEILDVLEANKCSFEQLDYAFSMGFFDEKYKINSEE